MVQCVDQTLRRIRAAVLKEERVTAARIARSLRDIIRERIFGGGHNYWVEW
jgi:hypothetical protein